MAKKNNYNQKVFLARLGCDKNDVDADIMTGLLRENGFIVTESVDEAEIIIINTCGFITSAKQESIDYILDAIEFKIKGHCDAIIVTGCLAERYAEELINEFIEVDAFIGVSEFDNIVTIINEINKNNSNKIWRSSPKLSQKFAARQISPQSIATFVKIAEGCNSRCSYCAIPMIRGPYQSRPIEDIVQEVNKLAAIGVKEINLVAQNTTAYGIDLYGGQRIVTLLKELIKIEGIEWFRLLYCYPGYITDELLQLIASEHKIASYLDIPIQHSHPRILRAMNRAAINKISVEWFNHLRKVIPDLTLRTTVMVGFPGEGEEEFNHLLSFINDIQFDHLGVFCFSAEEGTQAFTMPQEIDEITAQHRANVIREEQQIISYNRKKRFLDKKVLVLLEEQLDNNIWLGRSQNDALGIDGVCYVSGVADANLGDVVEVLVEEIDFYDIKGRML